MNSTAHKTTIEFEDRTVRHFVIASIIWGFVGMLVGRRLCSVIPARTLQVGFASLCLVIAACMLLRASV